MNTFEGAGNVRSSACFHCGLPIPHGAPYPIQYENQPQQTCCAGCQSVAQTIIDSGQGAYYVHRTALPVTPQQIEAEMIRKLDALIAKSGAGPSPSA